MTELAPRYNPTDVEERLYQSWESRGLFHAEPDPKRTPYTIVIPPPNVTGILHMGHALNNTIQDILIRYKRMQGFNALWVPGTDHAGIATQNVVEKQLAKEGKRRQDLGREAFLQRVWQWKEQYGNTIIRQLKRLGSSCDWQRTRFTMDEGLSEAVAEVFVQLYNEGLIYRGYYIINWCPRCQTALADEEAPRKDTHGKLYYLRYPLVASGEPKTTHPSIVVATTRPETMLGDTAIAVHPKDARYKDLIGRKAILPIVGRELPIIADELVDPEFGTGAVKVTPAHDPIDFQLAKRHDLQILNIMADDGHMIDVPEPYKGLDRFECRKRVLEALEQQSLLEKTTDHLHGVGHCYRCDTVVEPRLSLQWFVRMKPLAQPAIKAVKDRTLTFTPRRWTKVYLNWMENIQDWCISRQIWWGHRIPVYYCQNCTKSPEVHSPQFTVHSKKTIDRGLSTMDKHGVIVSKTKPEKCPDCGGPVTQDEDVLDTWFSSWLWPFSTLGWPTQTPELKYFYPTDTLVTAPEIIFFWVARMIMAGYVCMKDLPFRTVYIHGTVRDLTGKKMSKSLGNIIDPLDIIGRYGADALRYTLITTTAVGQDVFLSDEKFLIGRNFANKLWNVTRYTLGQVAMHAGGAVRPFASITRDELDTTDRWILSRTHQTITAVTKTLDRFTFNEAAQAIYDLIWRDFCDWYVELSKLVPAERRPVTFAVLCHVLETSLRLLHPIMPFVTEELWQYLKRVTSDQWPVTSEGKSKTVTSDELRSSPITSIMTAPWPKASKRWVDADAERQMALFQAVVTAIRNTKAELNVPTETKPPVHLSTAKADARAFLAETRSFVQVLAQVGEVQVGEHVSRPRDAASTVVDGVEVIIPLAGFVDAAKERQRIQQRVTELSEELTRIDTRLRDRQFTERAPKEIVEQTKTRRIQATDTLEKFTKHLHVLESL